MSKEGSLSELRAFLLSEEGKLALEKGFVIQNENRIVRRHIKIGGRSFPFAADLEGICREIEPIRKGVMDYVYMLIGIYSDSLGPDLLWRFRDVHGKERLLKIDSPYVALVEKQLGLNTHEARESFRSVIRKIYGQKISRDPDYDFMDHENLVKAVADILSIPIENNDFETACRLLGM